MFVSPSTYDRKINKFVNELKRLSSTINYGKQKKNKGKSVLL